MVANLTLFAVLLAATALITWFEAYQRLPVWCQALERVYRSS